MRAGKKAIKAALYRQNDFMLLVKRKRQQEAWISWPDRRLWATFFRCSVWLMLEWVLIYGGANWAASLHTYRVRLWTDAELAIPFLPAASAIYLSLFPMLWLSPFVLHNAAELRSFARIIAASILIAGLGFILLPSEPGYPPKSISGLEARIFRFADAINLRYNMCPSLHVAMAVAAAYAYGLRATACAKAIWWFWAATIAVSTLATHQHHVIDVIAGTLVGCGVAGRLNKNAWLH